LAALNLNERFDTTRLHLIDSRMKPFIEKGAQMRNLATVVCMGCLLLTAGCAPQGISPSDRDFDRIARNIPYGATLEKVDSEMSEFDWVSQRGTADNPPPIFGAADPGEIVYPFPQRDEELGKVVRKYAFFDGTSWKYAFFTFVDGKYVELHLLK
jgi:hypothetical protein